MTDIRQYSDGHGGLVAPVPGTLPRREFVDALGEAVKENPLSAALIGMGVLWMFMGGNNTTLFGGDGHKSVFRTAARGAAQAGGAVRDTAASVGSSINRAAHAAAQTTHRAGAAPSTSGAGDAASRAAGQAGGAMASTYDSTVQAASSAAETVSTAATSGAHALQETGAEWGSAAQHRIAELFQRQPLLLGVVGIAIGAGIAASIPTTEAEKTIMGDASDFVREAATETAAEVKRMANAAVEEAQNQGLTPEAAGEALRNAGKKMASPGGPQGSEKL
ncbi:MAG TPA: hypothetical protein VFT69_03915 [Pseudolabrys sp.]|nr:hypothetical protein [Pseudolabrys sp.]